jgi:hypothetical protein
MTSVNPEVTRIGPFVTDVTAPVVIVRIFPRSDADPIRILEFASLFGPGGYFQWIGRFCVTVNLDRHIQKFEVQFISEEERKRYTEKAIAQKKTAENKRNPDEVWHEFGRLA